MHDPEQIVAEPAGLLVITTKVGGRNVCAKPEPSWS
jgi:hypothetical protein